MEHEVVTYNPMSPGYFADPYPHYSQLRAENPVHLTKFGFFIVTRYEDVLAAYENPLLSRDTRGWNGFRDWRRSPDDGPLEKMMSNWLVMIDPPRHTPLREIHERALSPAVLAGCRPAVAALVHELLAPGLAAGGLDLVGDFANPLPVYVINHLLGLPRADWEQFVAWSRAISLTSEPMLTRKVLQAGQDALTAMYEYFGSLVDRRTAHPGDDVLSLLAQGTTNARMTREELLDSLVFLYQASHPTGTQMLALGLLSLVNHPDQLAALRADPGLLPTAIEELQRFDGPVQMNDRVASVDLDLFGQHIEAGQLVRLCLASANRDPDALPGAEELDITREKPRHFGYGHGLHYCVAAALGRIQTQESFAALLAGAPDLRIPDVKLRFLPSASNRGLAALPVSF
ncbi:cytochrome P450 [Micromonospora sp. NPDC049044]|uniref:cytochrome P450 n=1 Tax=Micromonospora sp. NPDC049044 TaxID=3154827 RepID=UPI0033E4F131